MLTGCARRFLRAWRLKRQLRQLERQLREMEMETWAYKGTGSSVTFRDLPLVPKTYADEVE